MLTGFSTLVVLSPSHRFKVGGIATGAMHASMPTEAGEIIGMAHMVKHQPRRNRTNEHLVGEPMSINGPGESVGGSYVDSRIAFFPYPTRIEPTRSKFRHSEHEWPGLVHFRPERHLGRKFSSERSDLPPRCIQRNAIPQPAVVTRTKPLCSAVILAPGNSTWLLRCKGSQEFCGLWHMDLGDRYSEGPTLRRVAQSLSAVVNTAFAAHVHEPRTAIDSAWDGGLLTRGTLVMSDTPSIPLDRSGAVFYFTNRSLPLGGTLPDRHRHRLTLFAPLVMGSTKSTQFGSSPTYGGCALRRFPNGDVKRIPVEPPSAVMKGAPSASNVRTGTARNGTQWDAKSTLRHVDTSNKVSAKPPDVSASRGIPLYRVSKCP